MMRSNQFGLFYQQQPPTNVGNKNPSPPIPPVDAAPASTIPSSFAGAPIHVGGVTIPPRIPATTTVTSNSNALVYPQATAFPATYPAKKLPPGGRCIALELWGSADFDLAWVKKRLYATSPLQGWESNPLYEQEGYLRSRSFLLSPISVIPRKDLSSQPRRRYFDLSNTMSQQALQLGCGKFLGAAIVLDVGITNDHLRIIQQEMRPAVLCYYNPKHDAVVLAVQHNIDLPLQLFAKVTPSSGPTNPTKRQSQHQQSYSSAASVEAEDVESVTVSVEKSQAAGAGNGKPLLNLLGQQQERPKSPSASRLLPSGLLTSPAATFAGGVPSQSHGDPLAEKQQQQHSSSQPATIASSLQTSPLKGSRRGQMMALPPSEGEGTSTTSRGISPVELPPNAATSSASNTPSGGGGANGCDLFEPGPPREAPFRPVSPGRPYAQHAQRLVLSQPASCKLAIEVYSLLYSLFWFAQETREDADSVLYRMPIALANLSVFYHNVAVPTLESHLNASDKHLAGPKHSKDCALSPDIQSSDFNLLMEDVKRFLARATCFPFNTMKEVTAVRKENEDGKLSRPAFVSDPNKSPSTCLWFEDTAPLMFAKAEAHHVNLLPLKQQDFDAWNSVPCYVWGGGAESVKGREEDSSKDILSAASDSGDADEDEDGSKTQRLSDPSTIAESLRILTDPSNADPTLNAPHLQEFGQLGVQLAGQEEANEDEDEFAQQETSPEIHSSLPLEEESRREGTQQGVDAVPQQEALMPAAGSSGRRPFSRVTPTLPDSATTMMPPRGTRLSEPPFSTIMVHDVHSFCTTSSRNPMAEILMPVFYKLGVHMSGSAPQPTAEIDGTALTRALSCFLPTHGRENFDVSETRRSAFIKLFSIYHPEMLLASCPSLHDQVKTSIKDQRFRERDLSFSRVPAPVELESEAEEALMCALTAVSLVEINEQNHYEREDLSHLDLKIILISSNVRQIRQVMIHCFDDARRRPLCVFTALHPESREFLELAIAFKLAADRCECALVNTNTQLKFSCTVSTALPPPLLCSTAAEPTESTDVKNLEARDVMSAVKEVTAEQDEEAVATEEEKGEEEEEELKKILPSAGMATTTSVRSSVVPSTATTPTTGCWGNKGKNRVVLSSLNTTPLTSNHTTPCPTPPPPKQQQLPPPISGATSATSSATTAIERPRLMKSDFHLRLCNNTGNQEMVLVQCRSRQLLLKAPTKDVLIPGKDYVIVEHQYPIKIEDVGFVIASTLGGNAPGSGLHLCDPTGDFDTRKSWGEDWPNKMTGPNVEPRYGRRATLEEVRHFREDIPAQEARIRAVLTTRENRKLWIECRSELEVKSCTLSLKHNRLDVFVKAHRSIDAEWMKTEVLKILKKNGMNQPAVVYTQRLWFGESFARVKENLSESNVYYPPSLEAIQHASASHIALLDKRFPAPVDEAKIAQLQEERLGFLFDKAERQHRSSVASTIAKLSQAELPSLPPSDPASATAGQKKVEDQHQVAGKKKKTTSIVFEKNTK